MTDVDEGTQPSEKRKPLSLLAKEGFGDSFFGDVADPAADADPDLDTDPGAEPDADADLGAEPDADPAADPDADPDAGADPDADPDQVSMSTVDELVDYMKAEHGLDIDADWFDSLTVSGKVRGEDVKYPISDIKAAIQKVDAADTYLAQAKEQGQKQAQEFVTKAAELDASFTVAATLIEKVEAVLAAEDDAIDWNALRTSDAAEYSAKRSEMQERKDAIGALKTEAVTNYQTLIQQGQTEQANNFNTLMQTEHATLLEKIPEWSDPEIQKAEKGQLSQYLRAQGFADEDIAGAADHRLIMMARKAMMFDKLATKADVSKKKVVKIPKTLKPGVRKPQGQINVEKLNALKKKAAASGKLEDAHAYRQAKNAAQQQG